MATDLASQDHSGLIDSLLQTFNTLLEMTGVVRQGSKNGETKAFYARLRSHYCILKMNLAEVRQTPSLFHKELADQALALLGSLVRENNLRKLDPEANSDTLLLCLEKLNSHWSHIRTQNNQEKLIFAQLCLMSWTYQEARKHITMSLGRFADSLETQSEQSSYELDRLEPLDDDQPSFILCRPAQSLFNALQKYGECSCTIQHKLRAKFELRTYRGFDMLTDKNPKTAPDQISYHKFHNKNNPTPDNELEIFLSTQQDWQPVRIKTEKKRSVSFQIPGDAVPAGNKKYKRLKGLCNLISLVQKLPLQCLVLQLASDELLQAGFDERRFKIDQTIEPISLSQCLEERRDFFTEKTKRLLYVLISFAVLHLVDTSWLQPGWGSKNIKFFQTRSSSTSRSKTPLRPFIQAQVSRSHSNEATSSFGLVINDLDDDEDPTKLHLIHRCPAVIALATVLIEVYFVKSFKSLASTQGIELEENNNINDPYFAVQQVFRGDGADIDGCRSQIPGEFELFLNAVDNCLNKEIWENEDEQDLDTETLQSRIYKYVVWPLELHLKRGFNDIPIDSVDTYASDVDLGNWGQSICSRIPDAENSMIDSLTSKATLTSEPGITLNNPIQIILPSDDSRHIHGYSQFLHQKFSPLKSASDSLVNNTASQFFDDELAAADSSESQILRYLQWKSDYKNVYTKFTGEHLSQPLQPVKIAILDTGIDRNHNAVTAQEENLKGKLNCYRASEKAVVDRNGHGTFAACLILDYAPDASLYVVKISDQNTLPNAKVVADAIKHAVKEWGVDIISMSFGWPSSDFEDYGYLEDAIDYASRKRTLMFAAASNGGGRKGRAYPASDSNVICVHSTDTDGNGSHFNPTAYPDCVNIATVGQCVQSAWPSINDANNLVCRSGTSFATPILAGIAAFLLQYARIHLPDVARTLKRRDKMEVLLKRCAGRGPYNLERGGYYYVYLSLDKHNLFGEESEGVNREICKALTA